jgi:hypothetical protein
MHDTRPNLSVHARFWAMCERYRGSNLVSDQLPGALECSLIRESFELFVCPSPSRSAMSSRRHTQYPYASRLQLRSFIPQKHFYDARDT